MRVSESVAAFLANVQERLAPKTYRTYSGRLAGFLALLGERPARKLKRKHVLRWIESLSLNGSGLATDTQRSTINAYTQWQKYAVEHGHLRKPILEKIKKPAGKKRERIPSRKEQLSVLRLASRSFRRIYGCLILTGARPSELAGAQIEEYDREIRAIVLGKHKTAKTGRKRKIGVGAKMAKILARAIGARTAGNIFLNEQGRKWCSETLSRTYHRLRIQAGLSADLVLYSTRHAAGTAICREIGIHAAAHALGHTDIKTTQRYCHPGDDELSGYQDRVFGRRERDNGQGPGK